MSINGVSHVGICVSDLERSLAFYREGLSFEQVRQLTFRGRSWARITEVPEADITATILRRDGISIELLHFDEPGHSGSSERTPMNQLGFTHLAIWVDDIDAEAARLARLGGATVDPTHTTFDRPGFQGRWLMCTDPDGVRLELIEYPDGEAEALGG